MISGIEGKIKNNSTLSYGDVNAGFNNKNNKYVKTIGVTTCDIFILDHCSFNNL